MSRCRDCHKPTGRAGKKWYCQPCRDVRNREVSQRRKNRKLSAQFRAKPAGFSGLLSKYPVGSRGWFRECLRAGHTAESLAVATGSAVEAIRRELVFVPAGGT